MINCVYHNRRKNKLRTSLNADFNVVSSNVYFVIVFFNIHCRKMRFSESSEFFMSEKSIFGHFEVIFLNVCNFSRAGVVQNDYENTSSFPFVHVTILIDNLFRFMRQLFYSSRVTKYFQNKWFKYLILPFPS